MKVLGIDPGTTEAGWCIYDTDTCQPLEWGHCEWSLLRSKLKTSSDIQSVVLEKVILYSGNKKGSDNIFPLMIENVGRIIQVCEDSSIPYQSFTRKEICETLTGEKISRNHKISKTEMQEVVRKLLKLSKKVSPQHANDALCAIVKAYPPCTIKTKGRGKKRGSKSQTGTLPLSKPKRPGKKAAPPLKQLTK